MNLLKVLTEVFYAKNVNIELFKHDTQPTYQTIVLLFYFYSLNYSHLLR